MLTPYLILNLPPDATDEAIRRRYLELVRAYPPEREPERFQRIAAAYETVRDARSRVENAIYGAARYPDYELALLDMARARPPRRRAPGLKELIKAEGIRDE